MITKSTIEAVKNKDKNAFEVLYNNCIRYVYTIVKRYISNENDHQDVIQEIFARIYINIVSFDDNKGEFKFWLRRLTINQCIKHYHKQIKSVKIVPIDLESNMQSYSNDITSTLSKDDIMMFLKKMPEGYKQIFMMVVIDEYSHQEISEMLNISPETSRSQLHRAKNWLRDNFSNNNLNLLVSGI